MGLQVDSTHKSKKQRRLEAMFNAQFGSLLSGDIEPTISEEPDPKLIANNLAWQEHLDKQQRELEKEFESTLAKVVKANKSDIAPPAQPVKKFEKSHKGLTVVLMVQQGGCGNPFRYLYKAPPGMFKTEAEHNARLEIRKKGLKLFAHIDTIEPQYSRAH